MIGVVGGSATAQAERPQARHVQRRGLARWAVVLLTWAPLAGADPKAEAQAETEVEVRGQRADRMENEPELAVSVVRGERLHQPGLELSEALRGEPSVQVNQVGSAADLATISIRGSSSAQVPVYLAGVRLNDDVVGVADLANVPAFMIERAVVYQSAPPLHMPRSGVSGALLVEPRLPAGRELFVRGEAGSFSTAAVAAGVGLGTQHSATSISVRRSGARNDFRYRDNQGTGFDSSDDAWSRRTNADFTQTDLWWLARYKEKKVRLHVIGQALLREQGVTGLSLIPAQDARAELGRALLGVSAVHSCSEGAMSCSIKWGTSASTTRLESQDPSGELFVLPTTVTQFNQRVGTDVRTTLQSSRGLLVESSFAAEVGRLMSSTSPSQALERRAQEVFSSGELSVGTPWGPSWLRAGVRYECQRAQGTDAGYLEGERPDSVRSQQCFPGARLGATLAPIPGIELRVTGLYGARFATLGERFGMSASMRGNPQLQAERGLGTDIGLRVGQRLKRAEIHAQASAYYRRTFDGIAYQRVALGYVRPFNLDQGRFLGADLQLGVDAWSMLRCKGSISLLDARSVGQDGQRGPIPFRSAWSGQMELTVYKEHVTRSLSLLSAGMSLSYRGQRVADPAGLIVIPSQASLDVMVHAALVERVQLKLRIENVTNQLRYDALGYPLPSRGYYLSLETRY